MDLIGKLLEKLNEHGVRYVHWKSNTNIDCALSGVDDFDVLVAPEFKKLVEGFFSELKIQRAFSDKDSWQDDIFHYIGFDSKHLKLAHVHIHYNLPVGYDFDKNFKLPIVDAYLTDPIKYKNVLIPEVEKEYVVLVIRLMLKNALTPFLLLLPTAQIKLISSFRSLGVVRGGGYKEFLDLKSRSNHDRVKELLLNEFNFISRDVFKACEATLTDNRSLINYFKVGGLLKTELNQYRNNSEIKSIFLSFGRINKGRIDKILARFSGVLKTKKKPSLGGRIIAFVGGDGAGKTTNIEGLRKKLSRHFWVETIHVGRPPKSALGFFWKVISRLSSAVGFTAYAQALFFISWALDRRAAFKYACKVRLKGGLVILDRIPLPGITSMDCPRVPTVENGRFKRLAQWEKSIYDEIKGVDLLFVLKLDPEIALQRRKEDDPDELRIRSGQIWNNDWHAPYAIEIDTGVSTFQQVEEKILEAVGNMTSTPFVCTEILGFPGAGKSTLVKSVVDMVPNTSVVMPFKGHPISTFVGVVKSLPVSFKVLAASKNYQCFKNACQLFASIEIIKYWNRLGKPLSTNYFFDQGPIFQLALTIKECDLDETRAKKIIELMQLVLIKGYFLKVESDTLWRRVKQRDNHEGRGQECESKAGFEDFIAGYEQGFSSINIGKEFIKTLDVNEESTELVRNRLLVEMKLAS